MINIFYAELESKLDDDTVGASHYMISNSLDGLYNQIQSITSNLWVEEQDLDDKTWTLSFPTSEDRKFYTDSYIEDGNQMTFLEYLSLFHDDIGLPMNQDSKKPIFSLTHRRGIINIYRNDEPS